MLTSAPPASVMCHHGCRLGSFPHFGVIGQRQSTCQPCTCQASSTMLWCHLLLPAGPHALATDLANEADTKGHVQTLGPYCAAVCLGAVLGPQEHSIFAGPALRAAGTRDSRASSDSIPSSPAEVDDPWYVAEVWKPRSCIVQCLSLSSIM